jgi:hypothetical protein
MIHSPPPIMARAVTCKRVRIEAACPDCGEVISEIHVSSALKVTCGECCESCAEARRRTADK